MTRGPHALVVAYDFPPHGAIGTMRTLRLVRHLDTAGWRVTVLTGAPETYLPDTPVDDKLLARVPARVEVLRAHARRGPSQPSSDSGSRGREQTMAGVRAQVGRRAPGWLRRAKNWIDFASRIPDREVPWLKPAVEMGRVWARSNGRPDVLFSSAPPWSGQVVALELVRGWDIPWVADFRDPWARAPWREDRPRYTQWAAQRLERRVVGRADAVVFTTRGNRDEFASYYGTPAATRFHLVPNGCDPDEFSDLAPVGPPTGQFTLLHAGSLYGARNPLPLLEAMAALRAAGALDDSFHLRLLGSVNPAGVDVPAECRRLGLEHVVELPGRVSREQSLREMLGASALLLIQPGTAVAVPAKAYEYMATGRPILALADEGETPGLVRESGVGVVAAPSDAERIAGALVEVMRLTQRGVERPAREFYDGNLRAAEVGRILADVIEARSGATGAEATRGSGRAGAREVVR